jgi:hypothetical protein
MEYLAGQRPRETLSASNRERGWKKDTKIIYVCLNLPEYQRREPLLYDTSDFIAAQAGYCSENLLLPGVIGRCTNGLFLGLSESFSTNYPPRDMLLGQ